MSDKVDVGSLQALIDFRGHLIRFNDLLGDEYSSMVHHWRDVPWDDDQRRRLGEQLEEVGKGIEHYLAVREENESYLLGLIQRLDEFLNFHG